MFGTDDTLRPHTPPDGPAPTAEAGPVDRLRNYAQRVIDRVRKALGSDQDTTPPNFNGMMLLA